MGLKEAISYYLEQKAKNSEKMVDVINAIKQENNGKSQITIAWYITIALGYKIIEKYLSYLKILAILSVPTVIEMILKLF